MAVDAFKGAVKSAVADRVYRARLDPAVFILSCVLGEAEQE